MFFTSPTFLFLFFPLGYLFYKFCPARLRLFLILSLSLFFYAWGAWQFLPLLLTSILFNYTVGRLFILKPNLRHLLLSLALVLNLSLLVFYKYISPVFPLGMSFYTFLAISYLIDLYRSEVDKVSLLNTSIYLLFFPHIIAGPLTRAKDFLPQLNKLKPSVANTTPALTLIVTGLSQKLLLANQFAPLADQIFSSPPSSGSMAWLGLLTYSLQIYFDFAGYSNLAIGIALLFGLNITQNFNYPYLARSIGEFWERWHISLTSFLRQYLYFPLGGSRKGSFRTYLNILLVFAFSGLWHGTGWTFLIWGLWHGAFMVFERFLAKYKFEFPIFPKFFSHLYAILAITLGWVFFRSHNLAYAIGYFRALFSSFAPLPLTLLTPSIVIIIILGVLISLGYFKNIPKIIYPVLFVLSLLALGSSTFNSFIYARF